MTGVEAADAADTAGEGNWPLLDRRTLLRSAVLAMGGIALVDHQNLIAAGEPLLPTSIMPFVHALSDTIIPATDTPGAIGAQVPAYVSRIYGQWFDGDMLAAAAGRIALVEGELDRRGGGTFKQLASARREAVLNGYDADVRAVERAARQTAPTQRKPVQAGDADLGARASGLPPFDPADHGAEYLRLRTLVIVGYYTSEIGGSQELAYEPVPGDFDPDLPFDPQGRADSNDE